MRDFSYNYHMIYWLKNMFLTPFNVLRIKTLKRTQYIDRDEVLLHASFQILTDYVEEELFHLHDVTNIDDLERIFNEWESELQEQHPAQLQTNKDIVALYRWWNLEYPEKKQKIMEDYEPWRDNLLVNEEDEMLIKLLNIRGALWT